MPYQQHTAKKMARPTGNVRWMVVGLCFLGMVINYIDRANLGVALPGMAHDLSLTPFEQGLALSAFFYAYAAFQFFGGGLADKFGPRAMYTFSSLWWGALTAATAFASSMLSLFGVRFLLGAGEAGAYPSCATAVGRWFPKHERALATAIYDNGSRVGGALSLPLVILIVETMGWRESFIITGILGLLFAVLWIKFYRDPRLHPTLNAEELTYIEQGGARPIDPATEEKISWLSLFKFRAVWGLMLGSFSLNFIAYFFITWMPSYLINELHFSLVKVGFVGMLPPLTAVFGGLFGGWLGDHLVRRGVSLSVARKIVICIGMLAGSSIALAVFVPSGAWAMALLCLSYSGIAFCASNSGSLCLDIAPTGRHVAAIMGIQNGSANLAGIIMPVVVGLLVGNENNFSHALMLIGVFGFIGAFSFIVIVGKIAPLTRAKRVKVADAGANNEITH
ncbi:MFS transporter [Rahnella woolbedingensis]|uniref:MFS transporter n=1 Tax=Rahnella woolbedingensis TaxID=1510574 RepID=A0A419N2G1_9GAMM|nr:MFS transporter [Rahnella woolbedingensis]RJT34216.1 MFS transporter [Rahnella woolbedingensis]